MEYPIKPILSLDRLVYTKESLQSLGATFNEERGYAVLNNYRYNLTSYGFYIGLNEGELCVSSPTTIKLYPDDSQETLSVTAEEILEGKMGRIYYTTSSGLELLFDTSNSKLRDIIEFKIELLSVKSLELMLQFMGLPDLINSFMIDDQLISIYPDKSRILQHFGNNGVDRLKSRCTYDRDYITTDSPTGTTDPYVYYLDYDRMVENQIGVENSNDLDELNSSIEEALANISELESLATDNGLFELKSDYEELTKDGDIADYISLKTLVNTLTVEKAVPPTNSAVRMKSRIKQDKVDATVGSNWDANNNWADPYLYFFEAQEYEIIDRRVNEGDLLEMVILFKEFGDVRNPITWNGFSDRCTNVPTGTDDPYLYWTEYSEFCKLIKTDENGVETPITWNGYHITYNGINENSLVIRFEIRESFMKLGDYFYVQIDENSVNLFSISKDISEYYIKSCKLIETA